MGDESLQAGMRDFIQHSPRRGGTVVSLIQVLQGHTQADLTPFLKQWTTRSARMDLSIQQASIQPAGDVFESSVVIHVAAEQDYDFFTSLAVLDEVSQEIQVVPIHITHSGDSIVKFTSSRQPKTFQIDPEVRVPQTSTLNDTWSVR
jgi:hypothetical protein